jgi:hypothetical protein
MWKSHGIVQRAPALTKPLIQLILLGSGRKSLFFVVAASQIRDALWRTEVAVL